MTHPLEFITTQCPHCGETFETRVDILELGDSYVEDCPTCCSPIEFHIQEGMDGELEVTVRREND
ncbi:CPXCG motif-containing cysteine-rich protein [Ectothiorhodospira variabilis]|uniref:CPXCG motif-containing cysteine-rich protein n=1 Tax=Ectothiorhodospira variabilis TaxID=505694 RepID=UPI001EFB7750|nr:CPXCG motif-containing cysteine-rich protein [Ectothiorhodospira variabilis]MCG5496922.1 CPXCG motif-containing cysteine-rich protein [Ectothiorhodospira variabilis]